MTTVSAFPDIPIIDHHCHAGGYFLPNGRYRSVEQHEEQYAQGFLEDKIDESDYRRLVLDGCIDPALKLDITSLLRVSLEQRENVGFARAMRLGLRLLHQDGDENDIDESVLRSRSVLANERVADTYNRGLDLCNIQAVLSDVPALERPVWSEERFKWIYRFDPFFYPFTPDQPEGRGTEFEYFHRRLARIRDAEFERAGMSEPPKDLDEFVSLAFSIIDRVIAEGAVGFKIVSAYVRTLSFDVVTHAEATALYAQRSTSNRTAIELSSYLARELVAYVASNYQKPIQVHVGIGHPEPGMDLQGSNPMHLQTLFDDPRTRGSSFIMLHGAYPFSTFASAVAQTYPNVFLDFSWMTYLQPEYLERKLVEWFEYLPANKLMFGSDTGLPEIHVAAVALGTGALKRALEYGVSRELWTQPQASRLAERALRGNLAAVYGL